eukprot:SAG31_NODE_6015_length_2214_cov_1.722931_1_plen_259_part_00
MAARARNHDVKASKAVNGEDCYSRCIQPLANCEEGDAFFKTALTECCCNFCVVCYLGVIFLLFFLVDHVDNNYADSRNVLPSAGPGAPQHIDCKDQTEYIWIVIVCGASSVVLSICNGMFCDFKERKLESEEEGTKSDDDVEIVLSIPEKKRKPKSANGEEPKKKPGKGADQKNPQGKDNLGAQGKSDKKTTKPLAKKPAVVVQAVPDKKKKPLDKKQGGRGNPGAKGKSDKKTTKPPAKKPAGKKKKPLNKKQESRP